MRTKKLTAAIGMAVMMALAAAGPGFAAAADHSDSIENATDAPPVTATAPADDGTDTTVDANETVDENATENLPIDLPPVAGEVPTDPDGDGHAEDLNGNNRTDFDDVVVLFENLEMPEVANYTNAYDFNDNNRTDFDDVVSLYEEA